MMLMPIVRSDVKRELCYCCVSTDPSEQDRGDRAKRTIRERYAELGGLTWHEGSVLAVFVLLVLMWFFRSPGFMTGWAELLEYTDAEGLNWQFGKLSAVGFSAVGGHRFMRWPVRTLSC